MQSPPYGTIHMALTLTNWKVKQYKKQYLTNFDINKLPVYVTKVENLYNTPEFGN